MDILKFSIDNIPTVGKDGIYYNFSDVLKCLKEKFDKFI